VARATKAIVAELFADVAQNPDDDEIRQVLADALLERGDPRGEFIMLQLSDGDPKRVRELLAEHAVEWLGPLAPLVRSREDWRHYRFARGFPVAIRLVGASRGHPHSPALSRAIKRSVGASTWSTVTDLSIGVLRALPSELLRDPAMRSLEYLGGIGRERLHELLAWDRVPYRTLNVYIAEPRYDDRLRRVDVAAIIDAKPKLAALRTLELGCYEESGLEPSAFRWIWKSWLGSQLECFGVDCGLGRLAAWLRELAKYSPDLDVVKLSEGNMWSEWVELTRDDRGRFSVASVRATDPFSRFHDTTKVLPAAISSLQRGALTQLRFVGSAPMPRQLAAIQAAAMQAKIPLELPSPSPGSRRSARRRPAGS
jgi:uncharacterized protein (TIGR02996 family)